MKVVAGAAVGPQQVFPKVDEREPFRVLDGLADKTVRFLLLLGLRPAGRRRVNGEKSDWRVGKGRAGTLWTKSWKSAATRQGFFQRPGRCRRRAG